MVWLQKSSIFVILLTIFYILNIHFLPFNFITDEFFYLRVPNNLVDLEASDWRLNTSITMNEECKLCNFTVRNTKANSSPNDVIFAAAIGKVENIIPFLRTLRTTGSLCRVVLCLDKDAKNALSNEVYNYALNCGCQFIFLNKNVKNNDRWSAIHYVRFLMLHFLEENRNANIDRILNFDLFDTVFQGDPFNYQVDHRYINVADEGQTIDQILIMRFWCSWTFRLYESYKDYIYICSGYVGASYKNMITFLRLFLHLCDMYNGNDQALYNYIYLRHFGDKYNIPRAPLRQNELVLHASIKWLYFDYKKMITIGDARSMRNDDFFPAVVHQYYRNSNFMLSVVKACPNYDFPTKFYITRVRDRDRIDNTSQLYEEYHDYLY